MTRWVVYALMLIVAAAGIVGLTELGGSLPLPQDSELASEVRQVAGGTAASAGVASGPFAAFQTNLQHPLSQLFIQLLVIIVAARLLGALFVRCGVPAVVGEMTAGILLGPSLLGLLAPGAFAVIFPSDSLGALRLVSQVGICLFMFAVGMELNMQHVRSKAQVAVAVSHASITAPFLLGVMLAYFLFSEFAGPRANFVGFALFMGISMSITAFPVLARILQERNLSRTYLGNTAITCAAVDDVTAWSIMAFVVAIARATDLAGSMLTLILALSFVAIMILGVRRALPGWIGKDGLMQEEPSSGTLAIVVCIVIAGALTTEIIGIHALFGAFLAGAVMPEADGFRRKVRAQVERFSTVLLVPLFFAFTGLRTQIGLLDDLNGWLLCLLIIAVATVGKLGASAVAARLSGMSWRESLQLGALMNTRGLMELIALNIGYDLGILSPRIFTMLVIMALITTFLTGPLLTWFGDKRAIATEPKGSAVV